MMQETKLDYIGKRWSYLMKIYQTENYSKQEKEGIKILAKTGILVFSKPSAFTIETNDDKKEMEFKFLLNKHMVYLKISNDGKAFSDILLPPGTFNQYEKNEYSLENIRKDWNDLLNLYNKMEYKKMLKKAFGYMRELGIIIFHIEMARIMVNDIEMIFEFYNDELLVRLRITNEGKVISETLWKKVELLFP